MSNATPPPPSAAPGRSEAEAVVREALAIEAEALEGLETPDLERLRESAARLAELYWDLADPTRTDIEPPLDPGLLDSLLVITQAVGLGLSDRLWGSGGEVLAAEHEARGGDAAAEKRGPAAPKQTADYGALRTAAVELVQATWALKNPLRPSPWAGLADCVLTEAQSMLNRLPASPPAKPGRSKTADAAG